MSKRRSFTAEQKVPAPSLTGKRILTHATFIQELRFKDISSMRIV